MNAFGKEQAFAIEGMICTPQVIHPGACRIDHTQAFHIKKIFSGKVFAPHPDDAVSVQQIFDLGVVEQGGAKLCGCFQGFYGQACVVGAVFGVIAPAQKRFLSEHRLYV